ncbi:MAG: hypothetical protein B6U72_03000 [Candidatus Altiarchaeales archaeon ex4484_2]|nr:MAG: hypothetical protein B6U72_03000 [Candidatus Altiarchaeales archaeon ex4484_2]
MSVLEKYAEKQVRIEKTGYLQLLKIQERDTKILNSDIHWDDLEEWVDVEKEKGFDEEDLRIFCYKSTHDGWYKWTSFKCENRKTGNLYRSMYPLPLNYFLTEETKETYLRVKALEEKFQEEERNARELLADELAELSQLKETIKELEESAGTLKARNNKLEEELREYEQEGEY